MSLNCIVLNVYNGDIIGIQPNLEYLLWYSIPLFLIFCQAVWLNSWDQIKYHCFEVYYLFLGIIYNVYWNYAWQLEEEDKRHRTEFYDSQAVLCCISYMVFMRRIDIIHKIKRWRNRHNRNNGIEGNSYNYHNYRNYYNYHNHNYSRSRGNSRSRIGCRVDNNNHNNTSNSNNHNNHNNTRSHCFNV